MYSNLLHMMVHKKYEILQKVVHKQGTKRSPRSNLLVIELPLLLDESESKEVSSPTNAFLLYFSRTLFEPEVNL